MKANGRNMGAVLSPIFKGEKPYDQAAVDAALTQLDDTAKKLGTLFPASVKDAKWEGDFSPSPKIWEDKAGYDAKVASFAKVVTDAKAKIKDLDSLKANFPGIGKECGSCHETYRVKNHARRITARTRPLDTPRPRTVRGAASGFGSAHEHYDWAGLPRLRLLRRCRRRERVRRAAPSARQSSVGLPCGGYPRTPRT